MQPRMESSVVLPLPDGPMSKVSSPGIRSRLTPFRACTLAAPSPRYFTTPLASSMGSSAIILPLAAEDDGRVDADHLEDGAHRREHAHTDREREQQHGQVGRHDDEQRG